jgi:hypothetical protein
MEKQTTDNLTKKERNELKKKEKQTAHKKSINIKKIKMVLTWTTVLLVIVALIYWSVIAAKKSEETRPGEQTTTAGSDHINVGDEHDPYVTNPPTSGAHGSPVNFSVYQEELLDENVVHNLEHGGIWISYKNLGQEDVGKLEDIGRKYSGRTVVSPRSANDSNVVVASWGRILELEEVDVEKITEYVKKNFNRSPEPLSR